MKIGFIGLGIMGSRMAANLQKHGYSLVLFNRTRAKAEPLLGPCGTFADSPAELDQQVDDLFTLLADSGVVEKAALGDNGFLERIVNKTSTCWAISPGESANGRLVYDAGRSRRRRASIVN